jgi:hypothetical protein
MQPRASERACLKRRPGGPRRSSAPQFVSKVAAGALFAVALPLCEGTQCALQGVGLGFVFGGFKAGVGPGGRCLLPPVDPTVAWSDKSQGYCSDGYRDAGLWDKAFMCDQLLALGAKNASACGATVKTQRDGVDRPRGGTPTGLEATLDCGTGADKVDSDYGILKVCSEPCMKDPAKRCCKVPTKWSSASAAARPSTRAARLHSTYTAPCARVRLTSRALCACSLAGRTLRVRR